MPHSTQLPILKVITQFANAYQQSTATGSIQIPFSKVDTLQQSTLGAGTIH